MYGILNEKMGLRTYLDRPYAVIFRKHSHVLDVTKEEFKRLCMADGKTDLPEDEISGRLIERGLIRVCAAGEKKLTEWQEHKTCLNFFMESIQFQITGRCNYNCRHCFNASDNAQLQSELSYEQIIDILDQAKNCGILGVYLTGGEPMLHPDFLHIVDAIHERDMHVEEIITNGSFITRDFLEHMEPYKQHLLFKISFDATGYHDWMRGVKGAEEKTLEALRLCKEYGFKVTVHMNLNKKNLPAASETLELLDRMGIDCCWLLKTIQTPRWVQKGKQDHMSYEEFFDAAIQLCKKYAEKPHTMKVEPWHMMALDPVDKSYRIDLLNIDEEYYQEVPLCRTQQRKVSIAANGNIYPCFQASGQLDMVGYKADNVFEKNLRRLLTKSNFLDIACHTMEDKAESCEKCRKCKYFRYCGGGCPAMSLAASGTDCSMLGFDPMKCCFFENRYDRKIKEALPDWKDITGVGIES